MPQPRLVACALLALLFVLLPERPLRAQPALWVAKNAHATVYLFGTVHLLPTDTAWSSPQLDDALKQSQDLTIELIDDDPAHVQQLVFEYGLDMQHPLASKLSADDLDRLSKAAAAAKLPGGMTALNAMQPWMAALTLTVAPLVQAGLDPDQGVDKILKKRMQAAGKPVLGLETSEQQIRLLADMSEPLQLSFLRATFDDVSDGAAKLRELIDAWKNGDTDAIARIEDQDLRKESPQLYRLLIVQRNHAWALAIVKRMQHPGVSFVAVGAGHLAGPDSLQNQLQQLHVSVRRE